MRVFAFSGRCPPTRAHLEWPQNGHTHHATELLTSAGRPEGVDRSTSASGAYRLWAVDECAIAVPTTLRVRPQRRSIHSARADFTLVRSQPRPLAKPWKWAFSTRAPFAARPLRLPLEGDGKFVRVRASDPARTASARERRLSPHLGAQHRTARVDLLGDVCGFAFSASTRVVFCDGFCSCVRRLRGFRPARAWARPLFLPRCCPCGFGWGSPSWGRLRHSRHRAIPAGSNREPAPARNDPGGLRVRCTSVDLRRDGGPCRLLCR